MTRLHSSVLTLALFILIIPQTILAQQWGFVANGEGSPVGIAADSSGMKIMVAMQGGGFWLTEDGGTSWEPWNDYMSDSAVDQSVSIQVADPQADTLLAVCFTRDDFEFDYHSIDGGQNWTSFDFDPYWPDEIPGPSSGLWKIVNEPQGTVYFACEYGFAYNDDFGTWWSVVDISTYVDNLEGMLVDPNDADIIYLYGRWSLEDYQTGEPSGGIIRSTDGGETWTRLTLMEDICPSDEGAVGGLTIMPNGDLIATTQWLFQNEPHPIFLRSQDDGTSWQWFPYEGLPGDLRAYHLISVPEVPGRLILTSGWNYGCWLSDDSGLTWSRLLSGLPVEPSSESSLYRNPFSGHLYIGMWGQGLFRSYDYGSTWEAIPIPQVGATSQFWLGHMTPDVDGFWQATTTGDVWFAQNASTEFTNFTPTPSPDSDAFTSAFALPQGDIGFLYGTKPLLETESHISIVTIDIDDWSQTWSDENIFPQGEGFTEVMTIGEGEQLQLLGYYGVDDRIYLSDDMGNTWDEVILSDQLVGSITQHRGEFYAIDWLNNDVIHTSDLTQTWESTGFPSPDPAPFILPRLISLDDTLYVSVYRDTWALTPENTWEFRGEDEFMDLWEMVVAESDTFLVGVFWAGNIDLKVSHDLGYSWQEQDIEYPWPNQSSGIQNLTYDKYRQRLWVDTGVGLAYLDFAENAVTDPWVLQPATFETVQAYPNPFNASTTIRFSLNTAQNVKLDVYDILGRHVSTLADGVRSPGNHSLSFDASDYPSGVYYLRYSNGEVTQNRKLVLVK